MCNWDRGDLYSRIIFISKLQNEQNIFERLDFMKKNKQLTIREAQINSETSEDQARRL